MVRSGSKEERIGSIGDDTLVQIKTTSGETIKEHIEDPSRINSLLLCIAIPAVLIILGYTQGVAMMSGLDMIEKTIPPLSPRGDSNPALRIEAVVWRGKLEKKTCPPIHIEVL